MISLETTYSPISIQAFMALQLNYWQEEQMEKLLDQALLGLLLAGLLKKKPLAFSLRRTQLSGALF